MVMAVKYQVSLISKPKHLILVTLNHLDTVIPFIDDNKLCLDLIENCYKLIFNHYTTLTNDCEFEFIRNTILNFFQDIKIKVSVFLREKVQNWNGSFILFKDGPVASGSNVPGTITYYNDDMSIYKEAKFNPGCYYDPPEKEGSYERTGKRHTKLGLNIYSSKKLIDTIITNESGGSYGRSAIINNAASDYQSNIPDPKSKAQLDLLCRLIGKTSGNKGTIAEDLSLNLFNNEEEEL
jgi:hypothetical protein